MANPASERIHGEFQSLCQLKIEHKFGPEIVGVQGRSPPRDRNQRRHLPTTAFPVANWGRRTGANPRRGSALAGGRLCYFGEIKGPEQKKWTICNFFKIQHLAAAYKGVRVATPAPILPRLTQFPEETWLRLWRGWGSDGPVGLGRGLLRDSFSNPAHLGGRPHIWDF